MRSSETRNRSHGGARAAARIRRRAALIAQRGRDYPSQGINRVRGTAGQPAAPLTFSLLALNGLQVPEAAGAYIEHLGLERGHRSPTITRKGSKVVTIALAPRSAQAIDLATGERCDGPVFLTGDGAAGRHGAGRIVRKVARRAGITKPVGPHTLRHAFITAALDAGVLLRDVQEAASHADPRTTIRYDRARGSLGTRTLADESKEERTCLPLPPPGSRAAP